MFMGIVIEITHFRELNQGLWDDAKYLKLFLRFSDDKIDILGSKVPKSVNVLKIQHISGIILLNC